MRVLMTGMIFDWLVHVCVVVKKLFIVSLCKMLFVLSHG